MREWREPSITELRHSAADMETKMKVFEESVSTSIFTECSARADEHHGKISTSVRTVVA